MTEIERDIFFDDSEGAIRRYAEVMNRKYWKDKAKEMDHMHRLDVAPWPAKEIVG